MVGWTEVSALIEKVKADHGVLLTQNGCANVDDKEHLSSHYKETSCYDNITRLMTELPLIFKPRRTWRSCSGSYGAKHGVERWRRNLWCYKGAGTPNTYCSNGDFIVAMLLQDNADFRAVRFYKDSGKVHINCGFRVVYDELR